MSITIEMLSAFSCAAELGSFSATARRLGKSQSTISETIANLEIELGSALFSREGRSPVLTEAGQQLLRHARQVLSANDAMRRHASLLADGVEARLTWALSDTYQSDRLQKIMMALEARFPDLELECLVAESDDVTELVQTGRAQLGIVASQGVYPTDIGHVSLPDSGQIGLFASRRHPLAQMRGLREEDLAAHRELRLNTYASAHPPAFGRRRWLAPSYLMLLEMARMDVGWAELPIWQAEICGGGELCQLDVAGWPRQVPTDLIWLHRKPLGKAGAWLLHALSESMDLPAAGV
ncbi:LysR family transcriptional regulator [Chromobacterium sp. IIBBL 290-4]|uniref:LysR family transcriptional regulator n=1 Tax=Chromobacterium sp. IIBBL 290-4 TaxID=2953890 RepID=UPI0020B7744C|nr:LysR family transcriptional regulator [Chromobacterium sp. IIBBL 290-4]UTH73436.1 LysR family transcriptional regulator [Chromobacterium sp. IIBBL 290-4]